MVICQTGVLVFPFCTKYLIDSIFLKHQAHRLPWLIAGALGTTLIDALSLFALLQMQPRIAETVIKNLRVMLQEHISRLPLRYFDTNLSGVLVSRIISDVEGLRTLFGNAMLQLCMGLLTATTALTVLFALSWKLTLLITALLSLTALTIHQTINFVQPIVDEGISLKANVMGRLTESLGGARVIKGFRAEGREAEKFAQGAHSMFLNAMRSWVGFGVFSVTGSMTVGMITVLVILMGGKHLLKGVWSIGDYIQYTAIMAYLMEPIYTLVGYFPMLTQALASLDRISDVLSELVEDADERRTVQLSTLSGEVCFEGVSFAYKHEKPILHNVSFLARPGTISAVVGRSGSGKSTIMSLLCAFYKPDIGRVLVDGIDLCTVHLGSYRSQLGLVLQDTFLFDGSIRDNILFSRPNAEEKCFVEACRISHVNEFVFGFPDSFDTIVGERGVKLSGGQRQRLSIARAILADPRILILDEATSSLDTESESMIQDGLNYLMKERTTFVVAHRLSTIRQADQILMIDSGRIVERGTHESLYAQAGLYYELYTKQYGLDSDGVRSND
jgi:ABC-type multidrug transport system fused ATPase/permease subunit